MCEARGQRNLGSTAYGWLGKNKTHDHRVGINPSEVRTDILADANAGSSTLHQGFHPGF